MALEIVGPLDRWLRSQESLEQLASAVQGCLHDWRSRSPANKRLSDFFNGTWLGHPLHATLTDLTIGAWTGALLLDGAAVTTDDERLAAGVNALLAVGLASVPATALAGTADWQYTSGRDRRVGVAHALANVTVGTLMAASLALRLAGRPDRPSGAARLLSTLGYLGLLGGAYLGGDLAFRFGVAVNREAWAPPLDDFTAVLDAAALEEGQPRRVEANGRAILLVRQGSEVYAISDVCTHIGGPLSEGKLSDGCVTCPWHGSTFSLADGRVRAGPATAPEDAFEVRVRDGKIEVRGRRG
jgi:nitrite reductase/ring-hydroxylating ferredoxin subunit/uncharacterized membrane protein